MSTLRRNPLAKERFLEGNRQRWAVLLILCAGAVMYVDAKHGIEAQPYLTFLTVIGCVFLGGMSVDSYAKIKAQPTPSADEEFGK